MRYLLLLFLIAAHSTALAATFVEFHGPSGKSFAVRVAAVDSVLLDRGHLEITTSLQKIRLRIEPWGIEKEVGLDSSVAAYQALLLILNGRVKEEDKSKMPDWLNLIADTRRPVAERMQYFTLLFAHRAVFDCTEIESASTGEKG